MMKRFGVVAAVAVACLASPAAAQEGTGATQFRLRGDEIQAAYPAAAKAKGLEGEAVVTCQEGSAAIWGCVLTSETPAGEGFGPAALTVVKRYENSGATPGRRERPWPRDIRVQFRPPVEKTFRIGGAAYELPRSLEIPSIDALYEAWPRAARFNGVEGLAGLWCTVTVAGRLEACTIGKEDRAGQGFGEAALKMAPLYRFTPARRNGAPVAMSMPVTVTFACDARCRRFEGARSAPPILASVPTPAQVQAAYPPAAKAQGLEGQVRLDCLTIRKGGLKDCRVIAESPAGQGFGAAALSLADTFSVTDRDPERLSFSITFDQRVGEIDGVWVDFPDIPMKAQPKGKVPATPPVRGHSRLRCQIAQAGRLEACTVLESTPPDPEVARQVLENLDQIKARDWTEEGRSTIGASVELTVSTDRFVYPKVAAAALITPVLAPGVLDYRPQVALSSSLDMSRYYPDRAQRMEVGGRAVLTCTGIKDMRLENCQVTAETPPEYGFGDAALKMARAMRYSPRTVDGVQGDEPIEIPIAFTVPR